MTRINTVEPSLLTDQHLLAEIRELPRGISYIEQCLLKKIKPSVPSEYTLGQGHVKFFYDKAGYLVDRQEKLLSEWRKRGYSINFDLKELEARVAALPSEVFKDFSPSKRDVELNIERLIERMNEKPAFYKHYGKPVTAYQLYGEIV